jgi:ribose/xylose/arabinose/galactoside ABC-type transport system permease subunit
LLCRVSIRACLGRHVYALGGNAEAARLAGVNVRLVTIFVYAVTGLLVGLAAVIQLGLSGVRPVEVRAVGRRACRS